MTDPNESTTVSFRTIAQKKQEFEIALPQNNLNKGKFLSDLFDQRRVLTYLKETTGFMVEGISAQNRGYLTTYCSLKSLKISDLVTVLIHDWFGKLNNGLLHTDTPIFDNAANSSQVSGIRTFTIANSTANNCKQLQTA